MPGETGIVHIPAVCPSKVELSQRWVWTKEITDNSHTDLEPFGGTRLMWKDQIEILAASHGAAMG